MVLGSLLGIYRQLQSQGSANALQRFESLAGQYNSPRMYHARLRLALHLKDERPDIAGLAKAAPVLDFFSTLSNLEEEGFVSVKELAEAWGRSMQVWYALAAPIVDFARQTDNLPGTWDLGPVLAKIRAYEHRRGFPPLVLNNETLPVLLDQAIALNTAKLEQEAEWQSGVIPRPKPAASTG
jgi:hypothetical protein